MRLFSFLGQAPVTLPRSIHCFQRGAQSDVILHHLIRPRTRPTQSCVILPQWVVDEPEWTRLQALLPLLLVWCSGALLVSFLFSSGDAFQTEEEDKNVQVRTASAISAAALAAWTSSGVRLSYAFFSSEYCWVRTLFSWLYF